MLKCRGNALAQGGAELNGIKEHLSLSLLPLEMDFICLSVFVIFFARNWQYKNVVCSGSRRCEVIIILSRKGK